MKVCTQTRCRGIRLGDARWEQKSFVSIPRRERCQTLDLENREISSKRSYFFSPSFPPPFILYAFYVPRVNLEYRLIIEFTRRIVLNGFYRKKKKFDEIKN